ncbi:MAG: hypothetical protein KGJ62_12500 [Armatimonadetes bacterium]|nr:hypothetical protein [Armatimonadota bacterium]MDE2206910.1 hypothetical protein [Armatimonadota bacterium]
MKTITASAPGRCGIVGNPSDMYGGAVVSCTVRERATCRLEIREGPITVVNADETGVWRDEASLELRGDKLDVARAAIRWFELPVMDGGFQLNIDTEIPMQAGMAGSTAILTALVGSLAAYRGVNLSPWHIAETTRKVESGILRILCGLQDQHMAAFGGLNLMDCTGKAMLEQRSDEPLVTVEPLAPWAPQLPILLAHTGVPHDSGKVHTPPRERWLAGDPEVRQVYHDLGELARRAKRAIIEADWPLLGDLMNRNHELATRVSGKHDAVENLIGAARDAGAIGAKLAGAGGGGTIIALSSRLPELADALLEGGAERILYPSPQPGLAVTVSGDA